MKNSVWVKLLTTLIPDHQFDITLEPTKRTLSLSSPNPSDFQRLQAIFKAPESFSDHFQFALRKNQTASDSTVNSILASQSSRRTQHETISALSDSMMATRLFLTPLERKGFKFPVRVTQKGPETSIHFESEGLEGNARELAEDTMPFFFQHLQKSLQMLSYQDACCLLENKVPTPTRRPPAASADEN